MEEITGEILSAAFAVGNELGCGFLEKVYENSMFAELTRRNIPVKRQHPIIIRYRGAVVGEYVADLLVDDRIIVELKHVKDFEPIHVAQCINYLKATGIKICLLINFGKERVEWKRLVHNL